METANELKQVVKEKYGEIAKVSKSSGCCGPVFPCCGDTQTVKFSMIGDDYKNMDGYVIKKSKRVDLPDELLSSHLSDQGIKEYKENLKGIFSITVVDYKN